uniref:Uncharacterized protein n=1 Tax=Anopheles melas TaxID=34690 RepID=A0A182UJD2_9DIPT
MQEQWEWMKEFAMPVELLQSIIYLQRALRDCVIQHQFLASKINILAMHQRPIVKRHMLELEREILSIGREQEGVVRQLSERVKRFQMTVQSQRKVALSEDIVCGYVSRHLAAYNDVTDLNGTVPKHISPRLSAAELAQKYSLETLLAASDDSVVVVKHENIDLEDVERRDSNHTDNAQWDTVLCIAEGKRKNKHTVARNCLKPLVTAEPVGRAQAPSTDSSITIEERPFAGIADQKPPPIASVKAEKQEDVEQVDEEEEEEEDEDEEDGQDSLLTPEKTSEDEAEADGKSVQSMDQSVGNRASWMPGLRGRPPKGSKYVSIAKQAAIEARRMAIAQQQERQQMQQPPPPPQPNIIQRRVSKRKDVLSEKVEEPIELDVSGNEEEEEE